MTTYFLIEEEIKEEKEKLYKAIGYSEASSKSSFPVDVCIWISVHLYSRYYNSFYSVY